MDWNSLSNVDILNEMGRRLKNHRLHKRLTQQQLAEKAGVSLFTVAQIERGKSVSMNLLIAVMRVLRLVNNFELLLPEQEISPVELLRLKGKKVQRIRPKVQ
ncbi:MAG: helix-turn-helix transcriptional regulator [Proteiniphilum sp.]|jgi:transcriptional regulator with XRE-family HTH domain|uniref:helix-turn-helix domain-containing protein n=1 Tax=Proteiniphilum sp. TaxID=1926877 RepID=UPI002B21B2B5|nr:helix-turn-helix transcriptional regulator [Proteiniphilum sp.]MEA5129347.1 helix-turn-helix transcriptional regulator [Proteiniphilum sp.]